MLRPTSLTACISVAALLAVIAAGPVYAQSAPDSAAEAQREPAQQVEAQQDTDDADADRMAREGEVADRLAQEAEAAERRAAEAKEAETMAPAAAAAAPAPEAAPAAAPAAVAAAEPADAEPVVLEARQRLAASKVADVTTAERSALADFYKGRQAPVWVTAAGFTPRARHAMAEIAQADDWGLEAKAFALPTLSPGDTDAGALADAEIKLSVAVLKYARHARGGRLEPSQVSRNFDQSC